MLLQIPIEGYLLAAAGVLLAVLVFSTVQASRLFRWMRLVEDTATAKLSSVHQGYVELCGTAGLLEGAAIRSPGGATLRLVAFPLAESADR